MAGLHAHSLLSCVQPAVVFVLESVDVAGDVAVGELSFAAAAAVMTMPRIACSTSPVAGLVAQ